MNRKAFTLVEVIAVIIIIALIVLILVPVFNRSINNGRRRTFIESIQGIIRVLDAYALENLDDPDIANGNWININNIEVQGANFDTIAGEFRLDRANEVILVRNMVNERFCIRGPTDKNSINIDDVVGREEC